MTNFSFYYIWDCNLYFILRNICYLKTLSPLIGIFLISLKLKSILHFCGCHRSFHIIHYLIQFGIAHLYYKLKLNLLIRKNNTKNYQLF